MPEQKNLINKIYQKQIGEEGKNKNLKKIAPSDINENKSFYKLVKDTNTINTSIEEIQKKSEKEKKEIANNLNNYLILKQAIEECFDNGWPDVAGEIALELNDLESAKKAMQMCFNSGLMGPAGKIAAKLNDLNLAKKAMQMCFNNGRPDLAGEIALELNDLESAKKAMQICFNNELVSSAGKIAIAINDLKSAKKAMQICYEMGQIEKAGEFAIILNDLNFAKEIMKKCFNNERLVQAGKIAVALNDLNSSKKAIQMCLDRGWIGSAGKIVIALNDDTNFSKIIMQKCLDEGWPDVAGEIALELNDLESAKKAMQMCFNNELVSSAGKIAAALAKNFKFLPEVEKLVKDNLSESNEIYGLKMIINLLTENKDLKLFKKNLSYYLFIKEYAKKANEKINETKKWDNSEEFFKKHSTEIANLHSLSLSLSTQLLKNYFSRGLSFADSYLSTFKPILENQKIKKSIKKYIESNENLLNGQNLSDLLEISMAYLNIRELDFFTNFLSSSQNKNFKELKGELNKSLLKKMAEKLEINMESFNQDIFEWKTKYISNLVTNYEMIKKTENEENLEIYKHFLESVFKNKFNNFISDLNQNDPVGKEIAKHNLKIKEVFQAKNINWQNWLSFKEQIEIATDSPQKQDKNILFNKFKERFKKFQEDIEKLIPQLSPSLEKDIKKLEKEKKEFNLLKINFDNQDWLKDFLPTYFKSLEYLQKKHPNFTLPLEVKESFAHLIEVKKSLFQNQQKEQISKKTFIVKLWDRNPKKDIFQGNETHCCIAIGVKEISPEGGTTTLHPETIFQYLIDKGINVAEIIDSSTKDVVAQAWLFITLDEKGNPVLVADNFEVNNKYPIGSNINKKIRNAMFEFLKKYAQASNIKKIVLGKVNSNDVETNDLEIINLPSIQKLGGYFNYQKYYLETIGHTSVYKIE